MSPGCGLGWSLVWRGGRTVTSEARTVQPPICRGRLLKVDKFLNIRIVSGEFIFILQMFTLQIVDKSTSYTFKIVN